MWTPHRIEQFIERMIARLGGIEEALNKQESAIRDASSAAQKAREQIPRERLATQQAERNKRRIDHAYHKKEHCQQVWLTWGTWLAFIAASVYAGIAAEQLFIMNRTYKEIQQQTTAGQKAAYAACINAQIARRTLIEMQNGGSDTHTIALASIQQAKAIRQSEAATITPMVGPVRYMKNRNIIDVPLTFSNRGKSAAYGVYGESFAVLLPKDEEPDFSYTGDISIFETAIMKEPDTSQIHNPPGAPPIEPAIVVHNQDGSIFHPERDYIDRFSRDKWRVVVYSHVRFADYSGISHHAYFCSDTIFDSDIQPGNSIPLQGASSKCAEYNREVESSPQLIAQPVNVGSAVIPEISCEIPK